MPRRLRHLTPPDIEHAGQWLALRFFGDYQDELPSYRANLARPEALESALGLTQMHYYRGVFEKAGVLLRSMVKNHPYVDGNKRLGLAATFFFLGLNGRILVVPNDEMVAFATELAATQMDWRVVARWIRARTHKFEEIPTVEGLPPGARDLLSSRVQQLASGLLVQLETPAQGSAGPES